MTAGEIPAGFIYFKIGFAIFILIAVVRMLRDAVCDLRFYWRNGWDFSKDSGRNISYGFAGATGGPMPNKLRLLVGYPFLIVGFSGGLAFFLRDLI